ncbi:alpha/beta fold hydrolase [Gordonia sp. CPCC 205515]|uniref:alpha/beta fold hydrolase n=1 Tax=Gordonia sp. CPCC 205515 TaxID=3140791 RepID=UPI003AF36AF9
MTTETAAAAPPAPVPTPSAVAAAFERAAVRFGAAVALRTPTDVVTYRELLGRARGMSAAVLARCGDDGPVVVQLNLSSDAVTLVLGVFASRRPIVALDPALPAERVATILDELRRHGRRPALFVADDDHLPTARAVAAGSVRVIAIEEMSGTSGTAATLAAPPDTGDESLSVTSIQFTSGSTGKPKGVLHPNAMWLCDADLMRDGFGITPGRRVALCMPISFGAGLNVLIGSLLNGADILALDPRNTSPDDLLDAVSAAGAETAFLTPSLLRTLVGLPEAARAEQNSADAAWRPVCRIITTGEALTGEVARSALARAPHATVTNWVGSSETSALAYFDVRHDDPVADGPLPAGLAAPSKVITVDADGRISVASPYLALGYLDSQMNDGRFGTNASGTRVFRTGDRGALIDGVLHLAGRMDDAVKIRGYLVDPSEVQHALLTDGDLTEAVVVAATDEDAAGGGSATRLIAYVVPDGRHRTPSTSELRTRLAARLPDWMVPAHIIVLDHLPRTARGKVDRTALPVPRRTIDPPTDHVEAAVAHIWARELGLDEVGRTEHIYALGADSLAVQKILVALAAQTGVTLTQADAAAAPTVAQLADLVRTRRSGARRPRRRCPDELAPTTVTLRKAPGRTVFCFTGAGASALSFVPLAEHLGQVDRLGSVYAFAPNGLDNHGVPDWTVGAAVRRHLRDLRRIQPSGPYVLVGHSLGGFLALEAARRLEAAGEVVELVVVLDTFIPRRVAGVVREAIPDLSMTADAPPLTRAELWRRRLRLPLAGLAPMSPDDRAAALEEVGRRVAMLHRPKPYPGRVLLVQITENHDDPRLWSEHITPGDLTVARVDSDHNSLLREPHIGGVVEQMTALLPPC